MATAHAHATLTVIKKGGGDGKETHKRGRDVIMSKKPPKGTGTAVTGYGGLFK
tara:strand:- start:595 stop:753 length:159 start_codon:yes stop_codon:yes gene_type:complete